jgi:tRNA(Ile2) C34 agmatinyltransferase TiaS
MDWHLASYIFGYYRQFMTDKEKLANRHLFGTIKATHGRTDLVVQEEARSSGKPLRELLSDDPVVLELTRDGMESFVLRTAERIMAEHSQEIYVNHCPRCGEVAKTPKARQCRFCRHDWHGVEASTP